MAALALSGALCAVRKAVCGPRHPLRAGVASAAAAAGRRGTAALLSPARVGLLASPASALRGSAAFSSAAGDDVVEVELKVEGMVCDGASVAGGWGVCVSCQRDQRAQGWGRRRAQGPHGRLGATMLPHGSHGSSYGQARCSSAACVSVPAAVTVTRPAVVGLPGAGAGCSSRVEEELAKLPGVKKVGMPFSGREMSYGLGSWGRARLLWVALLHAQPHQQRSQRVECYHQRDVKGWQEADRLLRRAAAARAQPCATSPALPALPTYLPAPMPLHAPAAGACGPGEGHRHRGRGGRQPDRCVQRHTADGGVRHWAGLHGRAPLWWRRGLRRGQGGVCQETAMRSACVGRWAAVAGGV